MLFASAILVAVITAGASYIQAKKAQKKAKEMTQGVEANIESNSKEIPVVYGERRVGGVRVYIDTSRDKKHKYLYMVLAMAEGEVESISDIEIDDIPITDARFITSGNKQNLWYEVYTGTDTQTVSTLIKDGVKYNTTEDVWNDPWNSQHDRDAQLPDVTYPWGDNHRLQGVAYLALKFKWDEKAYNGIPDVTAVVKGRKVYDPRTQTTEWSNNPALCIRDYLTNTRYGKGLPASAIDDVAFSQAATDCENFTVTPFTGSQDTHQLFTMDHVVDTSKKILENLNDMLLSCRAFLPYSKGVYSLKIDQPSASVLSIGADQIISGIAIAGNKKEDRFNQVKVNFFNKGLEYKEDQAIYPETNSTLYQTYLAEDDNEPLIEEVDIFSLNNFYSAREMARLILERSRQNSTIAFNGTSELINLEVGEVVSITHPTPAWTNKLFQVQEVALNFDGTVNITCIEYDAALYTYDTPDEEQPFIGSRLPDPNQVDPITSLSVSTGSYIENDGKTIGYVDASWTAPEDELVDRYEIKFEYNSREDVIEVASSQYRFKPTQDNTDYTVSVRAVNGLGIRSDWVTHTAVTSVIDTTPPALPTGITATGGIKHITLDWTNPTDDDFDVVEIKANTTDSESTATLIATVKVDNFIHDIGTNNATRYYYLRSKDRTGNGSEWTTAVSATTVKVESGDLDVNELSDISTDLGSITGGSLNIGSGTFTVDSSGNMVATSATIEGQGTFGDGIVASSESGTLEVGRAISDGTVKVGSQLGYYSSNGGYTHESFIEFRLTDMRIFMGEGTGNFKFEGGNNTGYDFERPVTFTTTPTVDGTNVALITDIVGNTDNYADSFSINNTTGVLTIGRTGSLGDLTADISTYVGNQVSALVDSAPTTLDTLNELAQALGDDPNFAQTVATSIGTKASKSGDTFTGDIHIDDADLIVSRGTYAYRQSDHIAYFGGSDLDGADASIYIGNRGDGTGYGWELFYQGTGSGNNNKFIIRSENLGTEVDALAFTQDGNATFAGTITASGYNKSNWDTAYGWGDHSTAGYLTSYTETSTLHDVLGRGNTTTRSVTLNGKVNFGSLGVYHYSPSGARVNNDARDSGDGARPHKWNRNSADSAYLPYYENWYDGNSYHSIGIDSNRWKLSDGLDINGTITASGYNSSNWDTAYTYSQVGHLPLTGGSVTGNITLNNSADLIFRDKNGTFPTNSGRFVWDLNNDSASIYAQQPSSDQIDFFFKITDNATSTDRFVFWIDDYRGSLYDKYPAQLDGTGVHLSVPVNASGTKDLSNARMKIPYTGNPTIDNNTIWHAGNFTDNHDNWDTAYTYSQVGHLPLSGGTLTDNLTISGIGKGITSYLGNFAYTDSDNGYSVNGTNVIDGSRNLVNIGDTQSHVKVHKFLGGTGDYDNYVIPLIQLDNHINLSSESTFIGKLVAWRGNALYAPPVIYINCQRIYNSTNYQLTWRTEGEVNGFDPVTFTYNGILYLGVRQDVSSAQTYGGFYIDGYTRGDVPTLEKIHYYDKQNGGTVINAEINDSIAEATSTTGSYLFGNNIETKGTVTATEFVGSINYSNITNPPTIDNSVDYINSASFNSSNGVLTLSGVGRAGASVDLDNRYQLILTAPSAPTITSTSIVDETIEIVFSQSSTSGIEYYEVWSDGGVGSYSLIAKITEQDFATSMSVVDITFSAGTVNYRVFAVKNGMYSTAATTSRAFSAPTLDVANLQVTPDLNVFHIDYNIPNSRFVDHVEIYVDANASSSSLSRSNASLVYSGNSESYTYNISALEKNMFHQFWVEVA